jgi:protein-disulfide isomerase
LNDELKGSDQMASRKEEKEARRQERLQAEQAAAEEARRKKLFAGIGAAALAAVVVVVALVLVSQSGDDGADGDLAGVDEVEAELSGIPQSGTVVGDPDAEVRIVEFGDLQCPACRDFSETVIPELLDGPVEAGDADLEFRQFAILGPDSVVAAKAALAASEQNRYWQFVELFYRNQGAEGSGYVTDDFLTDIARGAGVEDIEAWNDARENPRWDRHIAETESEAIELGLTGTPSIAVEGPGGTESLGSFPTAEQIEAAIEGVS